MMKPQQKLFGTRIQNREVFAHWLMILTYGTAPGLRAIESYSFGIGAVKVNRIPIIARLRVPPRRRTIMVTAPKKVMQPERRHVVDHGLVRLEHDASDRLSRFYVMG